MGRGVLSGLGLIGILILIVSASGCTDSTTEKKTTKHFENENFSFDYPADWTITEDLLIRGEGVTGDDIRIWTLETGETFQEYVDEVKPSSQYISKEGFVDINGQKVYQVEAANRGLSYYQSYFPVKSGKVASIHLIAIDNVNVTDSYNMMVKSFKVKF